MPSENKRLQLNDELTFLITCSKTDLSKDDIAFIYSYLDDQHLDSSTLIRSATKHGILPLVYKTLKEVLQDRYSCHDTLLSNLKSAYLQISQRNMMMSAELIRIMKLFKDNEIDALAFKGPTLSQSAYQDITLRQFGDLDILIKRSDISLMIDLMLAEGYVSEIELNTKMNETFLNALNVIGFHKSSSNIRVEIHWELLSKKYAIQWDKNTLWDQKESVSINNIKIPVLPYEQQLLYLCVHGSKHLFERLEWICDIDRSIRTNPGIDWQELLHTSEKMGTKRMLYLGLALCETFFSLELPESFQKNIKQDKVVPELIAKIIDINFSENSQEGKSYSSFGLLWHMREHLPDQLRFTWQAFFSPQFDDFTFIHLPKYLAFLYPILRLFRLISKYLKR